MNSRLETHNHRQFNKGAGLIKLTTPIPQRQTLVRAIDDYLLQVKASGRSAMTIASYAESLGLLCGFIQSPTVPLNAISADTLHAAVASLANIGGPHPARRSETRVVVAGRTQAL